LSHELLEDPVSFGVLSKLKPTPRILDVGCGIRPCPVFPCEHICLEPHDEYVDWLKTWSRDRKVRIIQGTAERIVEIEPSGTTLLMLDVIEHMDKDEGLKILPLIEKFEQAVIFTPLGFKAQEHPNGIDNWGMHGGIWQTHRSGWELEDFKNWETHIWRSIAILAVRYQSSCHTGNDAKR